MKKIVFVGMALASAISIAEPSATYRAVTNIAQAVFAPATNALSQAKQDVLVSGTNIKSINGQSILGSGNIDIQGGGGGVTPAQAGEISTNVVRDLSLGGIWDQQLQIWWTPRMINGALKYCATTNVNLNAGN